MIRGRKQGRNKKKTEKKIKYRKRKKEVEMKNERKERRKAEKEKKTTEKQTEREKESTKTHKKEAYSLSPHSVPFTTLHLHLFKNSTLLHYDLTKCPGLRNPPLPPHTHWKRKKHKAKTHTYRFMHTSQETDADR